MEQSRRGNRGESERSLPSLLVQASAWAKVRSLKHRPRSVGGPRRASNLPQCPERLLRQAAVPAHVAADFGGRHREVPLLRHDPACGTGLCQEAAARREKVFDVTETTPASTMASSTTRRSQSIGFALADSQIGAIRLALKAKVLVMTAGEHERRLVSRARPGAPDSQWPLWSSWNTCRLGLMLLLMLLNTGWQMRSEEGTNLTHCQWYPLFGLLPREHAYFSVRRQHCGLHGDGVRVRRNVIRQDQYRCLTIAHKVA
jgi:hypothetical protein